MVSVVFAHYIFMKKTIIISLVMPFLTYCTSQREKLIETAVNEQLVLYPKSTLQDIYKDFYQDKFGSEHAITSRENAANYLDYELYNMTDEDTVSFVEPTGWQRNFVRIPLALVRNGKLPKDVLLNAFFESAKGNFHENIAEEWAKEWATIVKIIERNKLPIADFEKDKVQIDSLLQQYPTMALHHSEAYKEAYSPHYRIVRKEIFEELRILNTKN